MDITEQLKKTIADNPIVIFMKGTPQAPQCGFSMRASQALAACGVDFAHVDVLANPAVRQTLPQISNWPTFPQIFIGGELIGGCDIAMEMYQSGELQRLAKAAADS
jgi:monothiol glutaredoxin